MLRSEDAVFHPCKNAIIDLSPRRSTKTQHIKKVFRLPDHLTRRVFPFRLYETVTLVRLSSPVTATGPRRIYTVFPVTAF